MSSPPDTSNPGEADHAGVAFHPPLALAACLVVSVFARWLFPLAFLPGRWSATAGPIVTALSFALFFWAIATMRRGGASIPTNEPTTAIVVSAPYSFSRNPIYLSMLLLLVGVALWANSVWFLAGAAVCAALLSWGVISREERYLERKFGAPYASYKERVRRWI